MVCELTIFGQTGGRITGTGWLAGPRTIITAGHCVFDRQTLLGFALSVVATPGRNEGTFPFRQINSIGVKTLQQWIDTSDVEFDIGAITLEEPIGNETGFFAAAARPADQLRTRLANVSGYPLSPGGGIQQFHSRNRINALTARRLFYEVDTSEGQSGAPVWILDVDAGEPIVVGVHTYNNDRTPPAFQPANSATLITPAILDQIRQWVAEDSV
jgi:V8-like Glu-specific endopeptidase